jgi:Trk-type K+ transport system membrane component
MLAIGCLYVTPFASQLHVWAFMVSVAVCFVLMMKSVVDLFVWAFGLASAFSGRGLGMVVRLIRSL